MCTFSPCLDKYGNSVRGVNFCKKLVEKYKFHLFDNCEPATKENPVRTHTRDGEQLKVSSFEIKMREQKYMKRHSSVATAGRHLHYIIFLQILQLDAFL